MTTVIATRDDKNKITFAWDSQVTYGNRAESGIDKVFANGPVVFGVAGTVRTLNILRYMHVPDQEKYRDNYDTRRYIVTKLIPAMIKALKEVDAAYVEDSQVNNLSSIILSVDDVIGYIGGDFSFTEDDLGAYAVGSGSSFALGALAVGANERTALQVAATFDLYTNDDIEVRSVKKILKGYK